MSMIKPFSLALLLSVFFAPLAAPASRAETSPKSACSKAFDQCLDKCDLDFANEPARRAACVPVCSGKFAACDAGVAYEKAKPWVEDQAKKTKDFFDKLIDQYGKEEPTDQPDKKTKDNSI